jgi:sulfane dehydrogenase subunit SoxC
MGHLPAMKRRTFLITAVPSATEIAALPARVAAAQTTEASALAAYGLPSTFERNVGRRPAASANLVFTPLGQQLGIITPSGLAYVRNHDGVPAIDPDRHRLLIHGLVAKPLSFSLADIMRFPSVERMHFVECAGNSARGWQRIGSGVQFSHGLLHAASWTGVPLRTVLDEAGVRPEARWAVAEGADGARFDRSLPIEKLLDDALLAYGQNGEMLRPEQGYPLRLILPGYEGSTNVKWLRRLHLVRDPVYSREETAEYSQVTPDGKIRLFDFVMEVKSVITSPAPGDRLREAGFYEGRGFAWSGRGRIKSVDVSRDGGATWRPAALGETNAPKNLVRFTFPLRWEGREVALLSRAVDETGAIQPTLGQVIAARGDRLRYHVNAIARWSIAGDGSVRNLDG